MGDKFWRANYLEGLFYMAINDQIVPRRESFTNAFFSNLKTVNFKFFANNVASTNRDQSAE